MHYINIQFPHMEISLTQMRSYVSIHKVSTSQASFFGSKSIWAAKLELPFGIRLSCCVAPSAEHMCPIGARTLSLLSFLALVVPAEGALGRLPPGVMKWWAALDNLIESADAVSSMLYIIEAHDRLYISQTFKPKSCTAGQVLHPVVTPQCLLVSPSSLPSCNSMNTSAIVPGEYCVAEVGSCEVEEELGNCFNKNVYQTFPEGAAHMYWSAGLGLYLAAYTSFGLTMFFLLVSAWFPWSWPSDDWLARNDRWQQAVCCPCLCCCIWIPASSILMTVTNSAYVMWVAFPVCLLFAWGVMLFSVWFPPKQQPAEDRLAVSLQIPVLGALVVFHSDSEDLATVLAQNGAHRINKIMVRILRDVPEIIIGVLDTYYFGDSWFATFQLTMSVLEVLIYIVLVIARNCNDVAKGIAVTKSPVITKSPDIRSL